MKIVSGGQTGVDMTALEFARQNGLAYGGWVPKGRTNEAGQIPEHFTGLIETGTEKVVERTRRNVVSSDATLIFVDGSASPGTQETAVFAEEAGKPHLIVDVRNGTATCVQKVPGMAANHPGFGSEYCWPPSIRGSADRSAGPRGTGPNSGPAWGLKPDA